jgi:hypothetical protein
MLVRGMRMMMMGLLRSEDEKGGGREKEKL